MTDTRVTCSTCGQRCTVVVVHTVKVGPSSPKGPSRWVQWFNCSNCQAVDEARWQEQRADEDRERLQAAERAARAEQRDKERNEKRKASA